MQDIPGDILSQVKAIEGCEGVMYTGSRQQGGATASSDWDFYVLLNDEVPSFRKTWVYGDTFIETFCNTLASINENELVATKISNPALHMLATGSIIYDENGRLADVQARARQIYEAGPDELDEEAKTVLGYVLRTLVDDLKSLQELSVDGYHLQNAALVAAVEGFYKLERRWMVKPRQIEADLRAVDGEWSGLYISANTQTGKEKTLAIIRLLEALFVKYNLSSAGEVYQVRK